MFWRQTHQKLKKIINFAAMKRTLIWIGALVVGAVLGLLGLGWLNDVMNFVATVYTRLFQLLAVPTIVLAVITTFATFGSKGSGRIFGRTLIYTLLTTFAAAAVGAVLFMLIAPGNLDLSNLSLDKTIGAPAPQGDLEEVSYYSHFISIIPNNIVRPFLEGNVLSLLLLAFAVGIGLSKLPDSENKAVVTKGLLGLQELLFLLIRGLIWALPLGILAFAGQLSAQIEAGVIVGALSQYVAVVMGGNLLQMFVVLPLFLLVRGLNPLDVFRKMSPAIAVALFTKSSAGTLPVTLATAEQNLKVNPRVSRFVLPICTTINMNGCAAFILVTSLFVMQNAGFELTLGTMIAWVFIAVLAAIGNAGVPMGCYFLTLSLMSSLGAPIGLMGVILPIYTIIDMIETAENVWSDASVCAMTNHDLAGELEPSPAVQN